MVGIVMHFFRIPWWIVQKNSIQQIICNMSLPLFSKVELNWRNKILLILNIWIAVYMHIYSMLSWLNCYLWRKTQFVVFLACDFCQIDVVLFCSWEFLVSLFCVLESSWNHNASEKTSGKRLWDYEAHQQWGLWVSLRLLPFSLKKE